MTKLAHPSNVDAATLKRFDADGWVALPGLLTPPECGETLATLSRLVEQARPDPTARVTGGTLHLDRLDTATEHITAVWADDHIVSVVRHHLGPSAELRDAGYRAALPSQGAQTLHVDWPAAVSDGQWQVCNALVALVDISEDGGATRVVPGTHREPETRFRAKSPSDRHPRQTFLAGPAGTAFVFSGHLLHSGTRNNSPTPRHALLIHYQRAAESR